MKKLFSEAALPLHERARTPVFSDEAGVIAVAGFPAVAERCAPAEGEPALKIEILRHAPAAAREKQGKEEQSHA